MSLLLARNALGAIDPACKDTPDWQNPYGKRCDDYRVLAYCAQGHVMRGQEWTVGADYKHPEQNCCVCGKGYVAPAPAQPRQALSPPPPLQLPLQHRQLRPASPLASPRPFPLSHSALTCRTRQMCRTWR